MQKPTTKRSHRQSWKSEFTTPEPLEVVTVHLVDNVRLAGNLKAKFDQIDDDTIHFYVERYHEYEYYTKSGKARQLVQNYEFRGYLKRWEAGSTLVIAYADRHRMKWWQALLTIVWAVFVLVFLSAVAKIDPVIPICFSAVILLPAVWFGRQQIPIPQTDFISGLIHGMNWRDNIFYYKPIYEVIKWKPLPDGVMRLGGIDILRDVLHAPESK